MSGAGKASFHAIRNTLKLYLASSSRSVLGGLDTSQQDALLDLLAGTIEYMIEANAAVKGDATPAKMLTGLGNHLRKRVQALAALGGRQQTQCVGALVDVGLGGYDMYKSFRLQAVAVAVSGPAAPVVATATSAWKVYEAICFLASCKGAYDSCSPLVRELVSKSRIRVLNQLSIESYRADRFEQLRHSGMMRA